MLNKTGTKKTFSYLLMVGTIAVLSQINFNSENVTYQENEVLEISGTFQSLTKKYRNRNAIRGPKRVFTHSLLKLKEYPSAFAIKESFLQSKAIDFHLNDLLKEKNIFILIHTSQNHNINKQENIGILGLAFLNNQYSKTVIFSHNSERQVQFKENRIIISIIIWGLFLFLLIVLLKKILTPK
jgi:hypothetical protein